MVHCCSLCTAGSSLDWCGALSLRILPPLADDALRQICAATVTLVCPPRLPLRRTRIGGRYGGAAQGTEQRAGCVGGPRLGQPGGVSAGCPPRRPLPGLHRPAQSHHRGWPRVDARTAELNAALAAWLISKGLDGGLQQHCGTLYSAPCIIKWAILLCSHLQGKVTDCQSCFGAIVEAAAVECFGFEMAPTRCGVGNIVAVAAPAAAGGIGWLFNSAIGSWSSVNALLLRRALRPPIAPAGWGEKCR